MSTFSLGKFTIRIGLRTDNPAFPLFLVYVGDKLLGKCFSMPDLAWCYHVERERSYADRPVEPAPYRGIRRRGINGLSRSNRRPSD